MNNNKKLLKRIESTIPSEWKIDDLLQISHSMKSNFHSTTPETDIVSELISLAGHEFSPSGDAEDINKVYHLCGVAMLLSFASEFVKSIEGMYKAVVLSLHLSIEIMSNYDLCHEFCLRMIPIAKKKNAQKVLIILYGDMGIALARARKFYDSISYLKNAIELSIKNDDCNSAARYCSELGRCYSELGEYKKSEEVLRTALNYAKRSKDLELQNLIKINLSTLPD